MSEDDFGTAPPKKVFPKGWVLMFDGEDYFYYNRTASVKSKRTPLDMTAYANWKIRIGKFCIMKIDDEGDPYYICIIKGNRSSTREAPVDMLTLFPYGIELLLQPPFFKKLDKFKKVSDGEETKEKAETGLESYLQALAKNIHCDENSPCDKDHECDLENSKCVPKSDKSYYDDLVRHTENSVNFVGKSGTIQALIDSISAKKLDTKQKKKEEKAAKKAAMEAEEEAAREAEEATKKAKKDAKKAAKAKEAADAKEAEEAAGETEEEAAKARKAAKKAAREAEEKGAAGASKKKKADSDLEVEDVLEPDSDNLTELQEALFNCLMPS